MGDLDLVVEIRKVGRWTYELTLRSQRPDVWVSWDCGRVLGLREARRQAERLLLELDDKPEPKPPPIEVVGA